MWNKKLIDGYKKIIKSGLKDILKIIEESKIGLLINSLNFWYIHFITFCSSNFQHKTDGVYNLKG